MPDAEQREHERVPADYSLEYRIPGTGVDGVGRTIDLSDTGAQFFSLGEIEEGTEISIKMPPVKEGLPPLLAPAVVVRCQASEEEDGYIIACAFD